MTAQRKADVSARAQPVNLRVKPEVKALIDRAATLEGKSRSEFMIEAARRAAQDALLDQTLFAVDGVTFNKILELLDRPPGPGVQRLLDTPAPWER